VPFFRVRCEGNELRYIREVLASGWLTTAQKTFELERRFSEAVGAPYACAVNSCTAALHLAAEAIGIGPGDTAFVPTMTFTSTAEVIRYLGAEPILLDVEYGTCLVTPEILEEAIARHPSTKALMVVHYGGHPACMIDPKGRRGILDICRQHGLRVIEDAAHAFPARIAGRMIGSLGDATCFSFYANKTITSGEGGMLTTHDEEIAQRARVMRLHGIDRPIWGRFSASGRAEWEYDVVAPGYKYNMSDINAAIGLAQFERAQEMWQRRYNCVKYYYQRLAEIPCIDLPLCHVAHADHSWHLFIINLHEDAPVGRDELIERLGERRIGTSVHYKPLHRMSYYQQRYKLDPGAFPNAERIWRGCLSLPLFPTMTEEDLDYVCSTLAELLR
jgi:dTDP-4-amino-4,6-dideoxygalactose transaminase